MEFPINGGMIYSWDLLVNEVKSHRQAYDGDLAIGWEGRMEHEFCCQNPQAGCQHHVPSKDLSISKSDISRFAYSVQSFIEQGGDYVPQEEANRRAEICMQCPYRIENTFCSACQGLVGFLTSAVFGTRTTPYDDKLGNCGVCKCYNKIAVHWPLEAQSTEGLTNDDFPDHCWKKKP